MKNALLGNLTIGIATIFLGIMAGFFWTYSYNINLAMLEIDGATYAQMQSLLNENVRHPMFFLFFFGSGALSLIAVITNFSQRRSLSFIFITGACLIYIFGIIVFTRQVNLPLNYYTESWNPASLPADWELVRRQWNSANLTRVITSGTAFVLGILALITRSPASSAPKAQLS